MSQNAKSKTFTVALSMVICLFFLWAISNNLLSSVVKKMMTLFDIDQAKAEFVETSYWFAYFWARVPSKSTCCQIPIFSFLNWYFLY